MDHESNVAEKVHKQQEPEPSLYLGGHCLPFELHPLQVRAHMQLLGHQAGSSCSVLSFSISFLL
jgi:hypothetical protein